MAAHQSHAGAAEGGATARLRAFVRVAWPVLLVLAVVLALSPLLVTV